jgi:hypothetical protein
MRDDEFDMLGFYDGVTVTIMGGAHALGPVCINRCDSL